MEHKPDMDFPNLPYLIHDGLKLSQTVAILNHLARTYSQTLSGTI